MRKTLTIINGNNAILQIVPRFVRGVKRSVITIIKAVLVSSPVDPSSDLKADQKSLENNLYIHANYVWSSTVWYINAKSKQQCRAVYPQS